MVRTAKQVRIAELSRLQQKQLRWALEQPEEPDNPATSLGGALGAFWRVTNELKGVKSDFAVLELVCGGFEAVRPCRCTTLQQNPTTVGEQLELLQQT